MTLNIKKELIKTVAGIGFVLLLYTIIRIFHLNVYQSYGLLLASMVIFMLINKSFKFKTLLFNAAYLVVFIALVKYLAVYGFFISCFFVSGYIIFKRRKKFIQIKQHIEGMIWGKPLKEYVKEGKKPPRPSFIKEVKD